MTKNELDEMLEGIVEPSAFESFHKTFELLKQIEDTKKQLEENARPLTTKIYHKRVEELQLRKETLKKQAEKCEKELKLICKKTCERDIHMSQKITRKVGSILDPGRTLDIYVAEYCPLCEEFLKIIKMDREHKVKVITKERYLEMFPDTFKDSSTRVRVIYFTPESEKITRTFEQIFRRDKNRVLSYFEELADTAEVEEVAMLAKQFLETSRRLDEIVKETENIESLLEKMCATFGHDVHWSPRRFYYCQCCSKGFDDCQVVESYKSAPMYGTVDFKYYVKLQRD